MSNAEGKVAFIPNGAQSRYTGSKLGGGAMNRFCETGMRALAACLALGAATSAAGQDVPMPPGPPPSWGALIPCAQKADPAEGFKCYQAALRAAGYTPNPEIAATERRRKFGLSLPLVAPHKPAAKPQTVVAQAKPGAAPAPPP